MSRVAIETTGALLRVYDDGAGFGAPYRYMIAVVGDEKRAILKGLALEQGDRVTAEDRKAIAAALRAMGFEEACWYRWRNGKRRLVRIKG